MNTPTCIEIQPSIHYFGTPVVLVSTVGPDGRPNLTPMSSAWALGDRVVLGLSDASQGAENLLRTGEAVLNFPDPTLVAGVEAIAATTGRRDVPAYKRAMGYLHALDKFSLGGWTALASVDVKPPRVAECPLQFEVRLLAAHAATEEQGEEAPGFWLLETRVLRTHAHAAIVRPGTQHVDTDRWSPLLYVYRHYFGTGERLGRNFRAET